jgi:hypothetical protein
MKPKQLQLFKSNREQEFEELWEQVRQMRKDSPGKAPLDLSAKATHRLYSNRSNNKPCRAPLKEPRQ